MKIYATLLLLLTVASLLGCNTLVTKPKIGKAAISQMAVDHTTPAVAALAKNADSALTSYRIDDVPTDLAVSGSETEHSELFSMGWTTLIDRSLPTETQISANNEDTPPPIEKNRLAKNNQTPNAPIQSQGLTIKPANPSQTAKAPSTALQRTEKQEDSRKPSAERFAAKKDPTIVELEASSHGANNLWHRIRNGYGLPDMAHPKTRRFIREYVNSPSYFKRIYKNAGPYLYYIVEEIEKRGMPLEIALLPAIESGYQPMALSPKRAAGLWQFIPATGRLYGLKRNRWYDGRRNITASTIAALNYLQKLHKMFDNDWLLALAAYNYGHGNLRKAIRKNIRQGKPTDFWSLRLPRETRKYVPKLLALSRIVANPQEYGIKLQPMANKPYFTRVNADRRIDWYNAAQLAGLSITELKRLNACYRRGVTAPSGPHYITLPIHKVQQFEQRLAKIPAKVKLVQARKVPQRQKHRVRKGDNLWEIAKRYGTTVTALRRLNDLKGGGHTLSIGQRLVVRNHAPRSTQKTRHKKRHSKNSAYVHKNKTQKHRVREGENLWTIAKRYGTTVSLLRDLNNFKGKILKIGIFLKVPFTIATLQK